MLRSLYSGISGMKANQTKMDVIGNNIANVGTTAFKSARVRFQDMLSQNVSQALSPGLNQGGINPRQVGLGVQVAGIDSMMSQGMMQPTGRNLDVAIDGEGYVMVGKGELPKGNDTGVTLKDDHTIDNSNGMNIMYTRDGAFNLDPQGNLLTSDGYRVMGYPITGGSATSISYSDTGATLNYVDANATDTKADATLVPLVIPDKVMVDSVEKRIRSFSIEKDGQIKAVLEDGKVSLLGQIAMSSFKNPAGLTKLGKDLNSSSPNSGDAVVRSGLGADADKDNSGAYGDMNQGMLEMSNVDLAEQFTEMIVTSRAFQASSKTITTGDEILQDIINLKR